MKTRIQSNERRTVVAGALVCVLAAYVSACSKGSDRQSAVDTTHSAASSADAKSTAGTATRSASADSATSRRSTILFAGTSLTAGLGLEPDSAYPMLIQRKIDSAGLPFEVVNAGVSGETSAGLLDRLDWLLRGDFRVLVLETGANDGLRGIPTETLKANLSAALDRIKERRPDAKIVVVQMEALPNLGPQYAARFHRLYGDVTTAKGVTLLPFLLDGVAGHRELNQGDGVHPNDRGEHMVAENLWKGLRPVLEGLK